MNISILLPLFNGENFLDECVKSIMEQTFTNWKLYIGINGHGIDSELYKKVLNKYKNNSKIVVKQYNVQSKPQTLNLLAKEVETEFVALIDVDDKWHKDKLKKQIPYLEKYDVIGTAGKYIGDSNIRINIEVGEILYERIFFHNCFINSAIIMRKEDVDFDDVFLDDYSMWLKLIPKNRKFYNVNEVLTYHRLHKQSFFNGRNNGDVNKMKANWLKKYGEHLVMMDRFGTTVILPLFLNNFNLEDIKLSLDSVLNQTWPAFECIIVINTDDMISKVKTLIHDNYNEDQKKKLSIKKLNYFKDKDIKSTKGRLLKVRKRQFLDKCMNLGQYNLITFIQPKDIWKSEKLFHQVFWIHGYDAMCVGGEFYGKRNGFQDKIVLPSRDPVAMKFYRSGVLMWRKKFKKYPQYFTGHTFLFHRHMNLMKVWFD